MRIREILRLMEEEESAPPPASSGSQQDTGRGVIGDVANWAGSTLGSVGHALNPMNWVGGGSNTSTVGSPNVPSPHVAPGSVPYDTPFQDIPGKTLVGANRNGQEAPQSGQSPGSADKGANPGWPSWAAPSPEHDPAMIDTSIAFAKLNPFTEIQGPGYRGSEEEARDKAIGRNAILSNPEAHDDWFQHGFPNQDSFDKYFGLRNYANTSGGQAPANWYEKVRAGQRPDNVVGGPPPYFDSMMQMVDNGTLPMAPVLQNRAAPSAQRNMPMAQIPVLPAPAPQNVQPMRRQAFRNRQAESVEMSWKDYTALQEKKR